MEETVGDPTTGCHPAMPADVADAVRHVADESGVDADTVSLAAKLKVAAVLTGASNLSAVEVTWRDLISRVATEGGREEAASAWRSVEEQDWVAPEIVAGCLLMALRHLTVAPDEPHRWSSLLAPADLEALLEASAGPVTALPDRRFHELFEERVRHHPDVVAAIEGDRRWTYRELNCAANKIAWSLHRRGLRPEDVVAVVTDRTLEWLAAVLAVFKAGGCYLPIEPHFPAARLAGAITRSECRWVLAERGVTHLDEVLAGRGALELSYLDELLAQQGLDEDLGLPVAADQLAYIYFTSGSTGEPKGAMCTHDGFLNHLLSKIEDLGIEEGNTVAQTAPQCFDISLWQLVSALLVGGRTLIIEQDVVLDVRKFVETLADAGVQVVQLVPSYLDVVLSILEEKPRYLPALRCLAVTGEALKTELVRRWFAAFPAVPLVNCYGTTEVSDDTNHGVMHGVPTHRSVPLGPPIRNTRVYVMDEWLQMVPPGAPGEIVFAGVCVGRGYVNDDARTKAVFGRDPYRPAERLYRSGDFGRRLPSGEFEYLGRRDSQVKVSGFRIEIGEIENRLLQVQGVRDGAVVLAGSAREPQLVGYYTGSLAPAPEAVGKALAALLPGYMVPRRLYYTPDLPLSANGKIDKNVLTGLATAEAERTSDGVDFEEPTTDTERRVAVLWSELLKIPVERISRGSVFVELGGTSLSAIRLSIALNRQVTVAELLHKPTVADVASLLDRKAVQRSAAYPDRTAPEQSSKEKC
jgi:amino acid adenylation domain-containing protein